MKDRYEENLFTLHFITQSRYLVHIKLVCFAHNPSRVNHAEANDYLRLVI